MKYLFTALFLVIVFLVVFYSALHIAFPLKYKDDIVYAAQLYDVDNELIAGVIYAESGFNPDVVSAKGAVGLMQVMPSTAQYISQKIDVGLEHENLHDPRINIMLGTCYLRYLLNKFGDVKTALTAYNAGEGNVNTWLADSKYSAIVSGRQVLISSPFPQTNAYVEKVFKSLKFYEKRF